MTNVEQLAAVRQRLLLVLCAPVRECDDTWFEKVVAWFDDVGAVMLAAPPPMRTDQIALLAVRQARRRGRR